MVFVGKFKMRLKLPSYSLVFLPSTQQLFHIITSVGIIKGVEEAPDIFKQFLKIVGKFSGVIRHNPTIGNVGESPGGGGS